MSSVKVIPGGLVSPLSYRKSIGREIWVGPCVVAKDPDVVVPDNHYCYSNEKIDEYSRHYVVGTRNDIEVYLFKKIEDVRDGLNHINPGPAEDLQKQYLTRLNEIRDYIANYENILRKKEELPSDV